MYYESFEIKVQGSKEYLEHIEQTWDAVNLKIYSTNTDCNIPIYKAYSKHIEYLSNTNEMISRILTFNILVNGANYIGFKNHEYKIDFVGFMKNNLIINIYNNQDFYFKTFDENPFNEFNYKETAKSMSSQLFDLSFNDNLIKSLLSQAGCIFINDVYSNILTWSTLYKMHDTIETGCKENNINFKELCKKNNKYIKLFTCCCNNESIIGIYSRHGKFSKGKITGEKISLEDSIKVILELSYDFCKKYLDLKKESKYAN